VRGHVLTTTGRRLEDVDIADFIDLVYTYAINAPSERNSARKSMLGYVFGVTISDDEENEDMTFEGFQRSSLSMLDELDDMHSMMSGVE
jgi:hypothetical protein